MFFSPENNAKRLDSCIIEYNVCYTGQFVDKLTCIKTTFRAII